MTARHVTTVVFLAFAVNASIAAALVGLGGTPPARSDLGAKAPRAVPIHWISPPSKHRDDRSPAHRSNERRRKQQTHRPRVPEKLSTAPQCASPTPSTPPPRIPDAFLAEATRAPAVRMLAGGSLEQLALATLPVTISAEPLAPVSGPHEAPKSARTVDVRPRRLSCPAPAYPHSARARGITGSVRVRFLVERDGSVRRVQIVHASPPKRFERTVERTVRRWLFEPARHDGRTVACWCNQDFEFSLERE